jgi:putative SbcD/Mre11-related phosphoesterase
MNHAAPSTRTHQLSSTGPTLGPHAVWPLDPDEPEGWVLTPERAIVHRALAAAIVADVHLGYEWARASGGDMMPAHSLRETQALLGRLVQRSPIRRLIIAGDLVESDAACPRTRRDVEALQIWLTERAIEMVLLQGNHDSHSSEPVPLTLELGGWWLAHGHRPLGPGRWIIGHHHPAIRVEEITSPCFLVHHERVILPAFSANAAGVDVLGTGLPQGLRDRDFRCIVPVSDRLLDFGCVHPLRAALRAGVSRA